MAYYGPFNSGAAVGSAGAATSNATSDQAIDGVVMAVYVRYNGSPPSATTDVTIATAAAGDEAPSRTLLTLTNSATDGWRDIRAQSIGVTGSAISGSYVPMPITDRIKVTIAGANAADSADVWLWVLE